MKHICCLCWNKSFVKLTLISPGSFGGFKLAHFWGFQWGNAFFPKVIPGYTADKVFTSKYQHMLEDDLALKLKSNS